MDIYMLKRGKKAQLEIVVLKLLGGVFAALIGILIFKILNP